MSDDKKRISNERMLDIKCPKCGHVSQFLSWQCINATDDNGMKEKVCNQSAFLHKCPSCETSINVEYPFLYHQIEDCFMVHYAITDEHLASVIQILTKPENDSQKNMVKQLSRKNYIIRIVRTKQALLEKIAIYEDGLDDRYVELYKTVVGSNFKKANPTKKITGLYFVKTADEGRIIQLYVDDKPYGKSVMDMDLYKRIVDDHNGFVPPLREDKNLVVDSVWAMRFFDAMRKKRETSE